MAMRATLILRNGYIWTARRERPRASALAVRGNTLVEVGEEAEVMALKGPRTEVVDLGGAMVVPGLWDAHIHLYHWCLGRRQVRLGGCRSLEEMLGRIAAALGREPREGWIAGGGWDETAWSPRCLPHRRHLDRVTGSRPAVFWRVDMHTAVANSAALSRAGLLEREAGVEGGVVERDEEGWPTGILRELAINRVRRVMPPARGRDLEQRLREGMRALHRLGVTGICDQRMKDQEEGPECLASLVRMEARGELKLRISFNVAVHHLDRLEEACPSPGSDRLRPGHVKIFLDGTLGSRTAWMFQPMVGAADTGICLTPPEQAAEEFRRAARLGLPLSVHAIGDRANRVCLDLLEGLQREAEPPPLPHRIEHVQILAPQDIPRLARLGVTASLQPAHLLDDMDAAEEYLGDRSSRAYRFASLAHSGALLAFGSDAPVADENPFYGVHGAVIRQRPERLARGPWHPEERLSMDQALAAYTRGAARAAGWDQLTGSLAAGKRADLVVLDRDLFRVVEHGVSGDEIVSTRVLMTIFDGEVVHREGL